MSVDYDKRLREEFYSVPGEHCLIIGHTGSGKTQALYYLLLGILKYSPGDTILWFDTGKSGEILKLAQIRPVRLLIPRGCTVSIDLYPSSKLMPIERVYFADPLDLFSQLAPGKINVAVIEPFFIDPEEYVKIIVATFKTLIELARKYRLPVPLDVFIDELQWLAPGQGHALNEEHNTGGKWLQRNIELLRSLDVRIVGSAQGWTKIRLGVRSSFNWIGIKRGAVFVSDQPRLRYYNRKWEGIADECMVIAFPDKFYSDYIKLPFYGDGKKLGRVLYFDKGEHEITEDEIRGKDQLLVSSAPVEAIEAG